MGLILILVLGTVAFAAGDEPGLAFLMIVAAMLATPVMVGAFLWRRVKRKEHAMETSVKDGVQHHETADANRWQVELKGAEAPAAAAETHWWNGLSGLERVGVVALGVAGAAIATTVLAPGLITTTIGGALGGAGAWFLRKGLKGG